MDLERSEAMLGAKVDTRLEKAVRFTTRERLDPHQTPRLRSEADTRREAHGRTHGRTDGRNNHL